MTTLAAVAAPFGRDLDTCFARIDGLLADARARGVRLLALPEAALGGYLADLVPLAPGEHSADALPPALDVDGPEMARLSRMAGDMVVTVGFCESDGTSRYNTVAAVTGDGVLGVHRKVHQPLGEANSYAAGDAFRAFDSPVGRLGMLICYDKAFPEAARTLALDGAEIIVCVSAWPAARTATSPDLAEDRWTHRCAKVVGPGGEVLATTGVEPGMAVAEVDVPTALAGARRAMAHLRDRRPETYKAATYGVPTGV
jgi:predicted amidohydrolase